MRAPLRARTCRTAVAAALATVVGVAALGGCASTDSGNPAPKSIIGTWQLVSGSDAKGAMTLDGATVTLRIDGSDSGGQGPCNAYGADVAARTAGPITIKRGVATTMACQAAERNVLEARYFSALNSVTTAAISRGTLTLSGSQLILKFAHTTK